MGADTEEGKIVRKNKINKTIKVCSPVKGVCTRCIVGVTNFCLDCNEDNNNKETFNKEFLVLPNSSEKPILGIGAMRELDLMGKFPKLFRTEAALAQQPPPIASASDTVTTQKKSGSGKKKRKKSDSTPSGWNFVKDSQGVHRGVREAMKSRSILKVGKQRIDGKWKPADAGLRGRKKIGVGKRKLRELVRRLATLIKNLPGDDGDGGSVPTSNESDPEADAIEDGTIFHRDEIFDVVEEDLEAAEAEEAWMEKRELLFEEATTDPLAQIKIDGSPTLRRQVTELCEEWREVLRAQVRPVPTETQCE